MASWTGTRVGVGDVGCDEAGREPFVCWGTSALTRGEGRSVVSMLEFGGKCFQGTVFDDVARDGFMRKFAQINI